MQRARPVLAPEIADYRYAMASAIAVVVGGAGRADQYSLQTKRPITLPLARELLHTANAAPR
jgi:hypothetical protein